MKISSLLISLTILISIFSSCGSESESNELLLGSWDLAQVTGDGTLVETVDGEIDEKQIAISSGEVSYVITFTEGSYVIAGAYDITSEYVDENGMKIFEPLQYTNASGSGTYNYNSNAMTIEAAGPFIGIQVDEVNLGEMTIEQSFAIESLTADEVIFTNEQERTIEENGTTRTLTLNTRSVWTKR